MKSSLRYLVLPVAASFFLATGCASTQGPMKTYEGPVRAPAEVAVVDVPEEVQVMAIDGREPPSSLLTSQVQLALLPGDHVFSLRYVQLFQLGAGEHDVVRSGQAALRFTAAPGAHYRLDVPPQKNPDVARQFARSPLFTLVNLSGGASVESTAIKSYAEASLIDTISKAFESQQTGVAHVVTNTDLLKDVWGRSSPEEREAFRAWINQQAK
ncbi:MAG TPA: DUF2057 family protein [Moraxellaceae bacterium]|nr:DUF2057 family protein [Moraxellaceae bacterium]